jgi:hypothetical protein
MTPLERRCGWLLLAYPAAYRQQRGEEMLGTLLQSAPADRNWPPLRDCLAMIIGGLQVRTAQNRRLGTGASLRLAGTLGCVLYLSFFFYSFAGLPLWYLGAGLGPQAQSYPQLAFAAGLLACTALLVMRPGGRNGAIATIVAVAALIAGTAAVVTGQAVAASIAQILPALLVLVALAAVSHGAERLPRLWLWPAGLVIAVALMAPIASSLSFREYFTLLLASALLWETIACLALAWILIDAKPAIGVAIFLGLTASVTLISTWQAFGSLGSALTEAARNLLLAGTWSVVWKLLATALVLAMLSSRRLRRQAAL